MNRILINDTKEETRLVVLDETGKVVDVDYYRPDAKNCINHVYKGVVKNVLPAMNAAFVDIGRKENAYLPLRQGSPVHQGQVVMVQIVKEEMLGKGARVTDDISLAGRYIVLLPLEKGCHISKKICDTAERKAMEAYLKPYLGEDYGCIVRTVAAGVDRDVICAELAYLIETWRHIDRRYGIAKNGSELYRDADFWLRVLRDYVNGETEEIVVDSDYGEQRLDSLLQAFAQNIKLRLVLAGTVFDDDVEAQLDLLFEPIVPLPSGGTIQIDHTEAMTVIDVNSAHYTGNGGQARDTALAVNLEAAVLIAEHLRLRNIGGIIICDFMDMRNNGHKDQLLQALRDELSKDKVKTVVCGMTKLGLVELTRKRERQSLQSLAFTTCPQCKGQGAVLSPESIYIEIYRHLQARRAKGPFKQGLCIEVNSLVARAFTAEQIEGLRELVGRDVELRPVDTMGMEAYSILALSE